MKRKLATFDVHTKANIAFEAFQFSFMIRLCFIQINNSLYIYLLSRGYFNFDRMFIRLFQIRVIQRAFQYHN